jgi:hypothetical protein
MVAMRRPTLRAVRTQSREGDISTLELRVPRRVDSLELAHDRGLSELQR